MNCANCGERICESFPGVYEHPDNGHHTVCDWPNGRGDRVATPRVIVGRVATSKGAQQ